ncbi:MAG: UDP-N-acetylmuramoyl-L-alanine--D-glutamate ligase [Alphaproteobacteria bacterium]|nr:UDP-N-acetylmuramoyl-L-alanine--D-glutamate ligase [Alphaproteobacteria bacterium]
MIDVSSFRGIPVALLGLGKSGLPSAQALAASGATVMAWDDSPARRTEAKDAGVPLVDLTKAGLSGVKTLVLSPGIPSTFPAPHPVVVRAREAGLEIVCDVDLLFRTQRQAVYVGITGTNGKSTTTALIGHVMRNSGRRVEVGGNIGTAALSLAPLAADGTYVIEMSSYQLELTPSAAWDVAVLLNISPDHLDRHGGMDGYVAAKRTIFARRKAAVVGVDDEISAKIHAGLSGNVVAISGSRKLARGVYADSGTLYDARDGKPAAIVDLAACKTLPGAHNHQNAAAAAATALRLGISRAQIAEALVSYPGLAHRQERIAEIDGVLYVNDSKATNADAAARALGCYTDIQWIAGGQAKEGGIAALAPYFPRIAHAWLIGEAANDFAQTLARVPHTIAGDLASAVRGAAKAAKPGSVVLLSPACASWDQFRSFEHRGETFRGLVAEISGTEGLAA